MIGRSREGECGDRLDLALARLAERAQRDRPVELGGEVGRSTASTPNFLQPDSIRGLLFKVPPMAA